MTTNNLNNSCPDNSGIISLIELHSFASKDRDGNGLHGKSEIGREFGKKATLLVNEIPEKQGFYLWGYYDENLVWKSIYLGISTEGKTSNLKARISEELKDERQFFWLNNLSEIEILGLGKKNYESMWHIYKKNWKRALKKVDSTHIIWVHLSDIESNNIKQIESDLIETLNPTANDERPKPSSNFQDKTLAVIKEFKSHIHSNRQ